jgi:hypothetical protein
VTIPSSYQLRAIVAEGSQFSFIGVNALTTIAASRAMANHSLTFQQAITQANSYVGELFGLSSVDIITTNPDDLTRAGNGSDPSRGTAKMGAILASFTQIANDKGLTAAEVLELLENISSDFSDGAFDGTEGGGSLPNTMSVSPHEAMLALPNAIDNFLNGPRNASGHGSSHYQFNNPAPPT